jgi:hypothetical protein
MAKGGINLYQNGGMKDYMTIIAEGAAEDRQEYINKEKQKLMFQNLVEGNAEARQELKNYKPNIYDFAEGAAEGREELFQNNAYKPLPYLNFNFKDDQGRPVGRQNTFPEYQKYQVGGNTDPGKLSDLLRQKRANDAALLGIRSSFRPKDDTTNVKDNLVVTLNKAKDYDKELTNRINNHPEFKKAMGGRLPMYQMGSWNTNFANNSNIVNPNPITNIQTNQNNFYEKLQHNLDRIIDRLIEGARIGTG